MRRASTRSGGDRRNSSTTASSEAPARTSGRRGRYSDASRSNRQDRAAVKSVESATRETRERARRERKLESASVHSHTGLTGPYTHICRGLRVSPVVPVRHTGRCLGHSRSKLIECVRTGPEDGATSEQSHARATYRPTDDVKSVRVRNGAPGESAERATSPMRERCKLQRPASSSLDSMHWNLL